MNREHVGMIFKFLPQEEQEELYNIKDDMLEVYYPTIGEWVLWSDFQKQEKDDLGYVESRIEDMACRPKGLKSFIERFNNTNSETVGGSGQLSETTIDSKTATTSGDCENETVKTPRQYSLVKVSEQYEKWLKEHTQIGRIHHLLRSKLIFMGEIPNMPGHCFVMDKDTGKPFFGYHTEDFIELTDEET